MFRRLFFLRRAGSCENVSLVFRETDCVFEGVAGDFIVARVVRAILRYGALRREADGGSTGDLLQGG